MTLCRPTPDHPDSSVLGFRSFPKSGDARYSLVISSAKTCRPCSWSSAKTMLLCKPHSRRKKKNVTEQAAHCFQRTPSVMDALSRAFFLEVAFFAFFSLSLLSEGSLSVDLDYLEGQGQDVQERTKPKFDQWVVEGNLN